MFSDFLAKPKISKQTKKCREKKVSTFLTKKKKKSFWTEDAVCSNQN